MPLNIVCIGGPDTANSLGMLSSLSVVVLRSLLQETFAFINEYTVFYYWFDVDHLRICKLDDMHSEFMTCQFAGSLRRSRQLQSLKSTLFSHSPFEIEPITNRIVTTKSIPSQEKLAIINIKLCLKSMNFVNAVHARVHQSAAAPFDENDPVHFDLLETMWSTLKPETRRKAYASRVNEPVSKIASSDWGDIGFQGVDPATDFRGMGVFALEQLVYFVSHHPERARAILLSSSHPRRFYPFAVTGINISAFIVSMLQETRFHEPICKSCLQGYAILDNSFSYESGPADNSFLLGKAQALLNDVYCRIFDEFADLWEERDPPNVMSFQPIFAELQAQFRTRYLPL